MQPSYAGSTAVFADRYDRRLIGTFSIKRQEVPRTAQKDRMGGIRQTALRRTRRGSLLSQPVHAQGGDPEFAPRQRRCRDGCVPMEGLQDQKSQSPEGHASRNGGVHSPVPDPRSASGVSPDSPYRFPCQRHPPRKARNHQITVGRRGARRPGNIRRQDRPSGRTILGSDVPGMQRQHGRHRDFRARPDPEISLATLENRRMKQGRTFVLTCGAPAPHGSVWLKLRSTTNAPDPRAQRASFCKNDRCSLSNSASTPPQKSATQAATELSRTEQSP